MTKDHETFKKTCLCCGYITLESDSYDICNICGWQDDPACWDDPHFSKGTNTISLIVAQRNFINIGACDEVRSHRVRKPTSKDIKDPKWKPILYQYEGLAKAVEDLNEIARSLEPKRDSLVDKGDEVCAEDIAPELDLKLEGQTVNEDTVSEYLPYCWEMPTDGKLLYSDRELQEALKVIMFNLGVRKTLDLIPLELIKQKY